ncbi:ankyrin repeat domain-containing protein 31 isoform X2 [Dendropsophus ebraccatus]|uniref:ankyrin repeat domain-containing protein 31 isoform X2 n=1 Tax=Dendropsophus ebraccatus TaxID=150705 RepID=UPI00383114F6
MWGTKSEKHEDGDGSPSKKSPVFTDYDSDETVVDDSILGSDEENDHLCLKRFSILLSLTFWMFINGHVPTTPDASVCPQKSVGIQSPEIHVISKSDPAAHIDSMETNTGQDFAILSEEEASQSLLRKWKGNLQYAVPPLRDNSPCQPTMDHTDLCEDSQQLFDSFEQEVQENTRVEESQETQCLVPGIMAMDASCSEKEIVDYIKEGVQNKDYNVSKMSKDGGAKTVSEEDQSTSFFDEMTIGEFLLLSNESDSFPQLTDIIDDLPFLEMPEDGSGELNTALLAAVNSMQSSPVQSASHRHTIEREIRQVDCESSNDHMMFPDLVFTDESVEYKKQEKGLYKQKINKEILEETLVESNVSPSSLFNGIGCTPRVSSHLSNAGEKSVTQKSPQDFEDKEKLIVTKGDCENVSWNDVSCSQTSLSILEQVKPASKVSKTATYNKDNWKSKISPQRTSNINQTPKNAKGQKRSESSTAAEINVRKSARLEFRRNRGSSHKRECRTDPACRIEERKKTNNCIPPDLFERNRLNNTESARHCTTSKSFRNIHKRDFRGETLLHKACINSDLEKVNALIEAGINVNQTDNAGWTALHEASCMGNTEIILALIHAGANVNCKGLDGITPLHDAVYCNDFKAVGIFMQFGANPFETDNNMENAFDKCRSDEMAEILKSHCRFTCTPTEDGTANKEEPHLNMKPNLATGSNICRTGDKPSVDILDTLHDIASKQKKLMSTGLEASEDAETYIDELNEIQNLLNNIVNLHKTEKDSLAKEQRASADSFKLGTLQDKISKLASNQKTLVQVIRNQNEVTQKIAAHQQAKRSLANKGETSSTLHHCDTAPGRNQISALCAVNEWLDANTTNGSTMTTKIPAVERVPDTESNQSQRTISRCISGPEISRTTELPTVSVISRSLHNANLTSKQKPMGLENGPLIFDSCFSNAPVELHDRMNDHLASTSSNRKSHYSFPVDNTLDMGKSNILVEKISHERDQTVDTDQQLHKYNYEKALQQEDDDFPALADLSKYWRPQHKAIGKTNYIKNQSVDKKNVSRPASEKEHTRIETGRKKKGFSLKKLIKLGVLKPGVNVLNFQLQDYSHKATLLCDGQVTDCLGAVFRDPVQWVKTLLGNNISVTWKYVIDKVTYFGKKLSSFIGQEDFAPRTMRESNRKKSVLPSHHLPGHAVLQVNEIVLVDKRELLPSHIMDELWEEFMNNGGNDL